MGFYFAYACTFSLPRAWNCKSEVSIIMFSEKFVTPDKIALGTGLTPGWITQALGR